MRLRESPRRPRLLPQGLLLIAAMLAGCAAQSCDPRQGTVVPVAIRGNHPYAQVRLNGRPAEMLVDTGSTHTGLMAGAAARLGLPVDPGSRGTIQGIGGTAETHNVRVESLRFGVTELRNLSLPVATAPDFERDEPGVAGMIGADLLGRGDVELALGARRLVLHGTGCAATGGPPWDMPFMTLPMRLTAGGRPLLTLMLDGQVMTALLDTGAQGTVITAAAARRLGVDAAALAADPTGVGTGAGGAGGQRVWLHRFESLRIGGQQVTGPRISVVDADLPDAEMLLGMDIIPALRLWIAYGAGRLFIALPRDAR